MQQDLLYSLRLLRRHPWATLVSVVVLAVGIAASTTVFSVLNASLLRPLPFRDPERLVITLGARPALGRFFDAVSYGNYLDWREQSEAFVDLAASSGTRSVNLTGHDLPTSLRIEYVTANLFDLLGVAPHIGRDFSPDEERAPAAGPVILSHALWQRLFGGDESVLGRTVRLNDLPFEVVGVLPPEYRGLQWDPIDAWLPIGAAAPLLGERYVTRNTTWLIAVGRLGEGRTLAAADDDMRRITEALEAQYPKLNEGVRAVLYELESFYYGEETRRTLLFLLLSAAFVLLMCCGNVASFLLGQTLSRRREMALRSALGATPVRLARMSLVHGLLLSSAASLLALFVTLRVSPRLVALSDLPPASFDATWVDARVLGLAVGLALFSALLFTTLPTVVLSRYGLAEALKEGARSAGSLSGSRLRALLVVVEIAAAIVLVASAGLLLQDLRRLTGQRAGFSTEGMLAVKIDLPASRYEPPAAVRYAEETLRRSRILTEVEEATLTGPLLAPFAAMISELTTEEMQDREEEAAAVVVYRHSVAPGYFAALGIPLVSGRGFRSSDDDRHVPVAVVSESLARQLWPDQEASGRRFRLRPSPVHGSEEAWVTVVGVAEDTLHRGQGPGSGADFDIYLPFQQAPERSFYLLTRSRQAVADVARRLQRELTPLDPSVPLDRWETLRGRFALASADTRFTSILTTLFSTVALLLALVGTTGALILAVGERQREIGIRSALGASPRDTTLLVIGESLRLILPGFLFGALAFLLARRLLESVLVDTPAGDPITLLATLAILALALAVATLVPLRSALRVRPSVVLREP